MKRWLLGWMCLSVCLSAWGNVVIVGTRVIYPAQASDVSVHLRHQGDYPVLVQVWVDQYGPSASAADVPFVVSPPVFRMEANEGQSVRVLYTQEALPSDRETLFQFNVLETPPSPDAPSRNYLQLALASKLKLFFRPEGLSGTAAEAAASLRWRVSAQAPNRLELINPTPFHVSVSSIRSAVAGLIYGEQAQGVVVYPYSETSVPVSQNMIKTSALPQGQRLTFTYINDFGMATVQAATLQLP